jgi:hypothetical protein
LEPRKGTRCNCDFDKTAWWVSDRVLGYFHWNGGQKVRVRIGIYEITTNIHRVSGDYAVLLSTGISRQVRPKMGYIIKDKPFYAIQIRHKMEPGAFSPLCLPGDPASALEALSCVFSPSYSLPLPFRLLAV